MLSSRKVVKSFRGRFKGVKGVKSVKLARSAVKTVGGESSYPGYLRRISAARQRPRL